MEVDNNGNLLMKLPEEIVEMVLRHLDPDARRAAVLVCQAFYELICRLEKEKRLKVKEDAMERFSDEVFESIMSSRRRISEIEVSVGSVDRAIIDRIIAVISKFKPYLKKLKVDYYLSQCSKVDYLKLLNAASDVEELSLDIPEGFIKSARCFVPLVTFGKLKRLYLHSVPRIEDCLDRVPNDSLETLSFGDWNSKLPQRSVQDFLNCQTKIKQLHYLTDKIFDIDHLVLEELELSGINLVRILEKQPLLRSLITREIIDEGLAQICKLRHLKKLNTCVYFVSDEALAALGNLRSLKELTLERCSDGWRDYGYYWTGFEVLSQTELPALKKLTLNIELSLGREHFVTLARSLPQLQRLEIRNQGNDFLAIIIDEFTELKSLILLEYEFNGDEYNERPTKQNHSLEEFIFGKDIDPSSYNNLCFTINACPNLKRIHLQDSALLDKQILDILQKHPRLTHFSASVTRTPPKKIFKPLQWLLEILNIFRNSPDFIHLTLMRIKNLNRKLVEHWLRSDNFRATFSGMPSYGMNLKIVKKSKTPDPHKDFDNGLY